MHLAVEAGAVKEGVSEFLPSRQVLGGCHQVCAIKAGVVEAGF